MRIEGVILKKDRGFYKKYIEIPCPLDCGKMLKGTSKKHWLRNFEIHLTGKKHNIKDKDEQKRIVEKVRKDIIENL